MADRSLDGYEGLGYEDQLVIDRLCTRYEEALLAGEAPSLEAYVQEGGERVAACLLTELVALDRAYRSRRGEDSSLEDYTARFPAFAEVLAEAFRSSGTHLPSKKPPPGPTPTPTVEGYEVLGELGKGGMGVVFKARHLRLKRVVALKLILQGDFASEHHRARFLVEAEMLGRLRHPNVVQVFEAGQQDGRPFLALEYVEGGTLAQRLAAEGALPPREAAGLVGQLAHAVHHAHQQGVLHRDLKPANILLAPSPAGPVPKITDFGLACQSEGMNEHSVTGLVIGTPAYMSPEQARGERQSLGPTADVYSLGVVLYEALTGRPPFRAATPMETVRQVLTDAPAAPSKLRPGLDPDLATICLKCLRKEPEDRYRNAEALADDLTRWLDGEPIAARPAGAVERAWKWARRNPGQAAWLTLTLLLVAAVIALPTAAALRLGREQELTRQAEEQRRVALVQSLQSAAPDSVPLLVDVFAPAADQIRPLLHEQLSDPRTRFRAAVALTLMGDDQSAHLVGAIPSTPPAESTNLARAFRASNDPRLAEELHRRGEAAAELTWRVRHAILLLDLGDARLARSLFGTPDPAPRSTLFEEIPTWHGTLAALPAVLDAADGDVCSALCAAVGRVDPTRLDAEVHQALAAALARRFQFAPDPGTHAAAEWALRRWGVALPAVAAGERRWFVNSAAMTMMRIPEGVLRTAYGPAVLGRPYYIADREVTLGQFRKFFADKEAVLPRTKAPHATLDLGGEHPFHKGFVADVLLFCNWLSVGEGRRPCYAPDKKAPGRWACDFTADGYRLPTDAEWDHAHRAGSQARFFFGDHARWLPLYGHVADQVTAPCAGKVPNRWGLFDVVGNVWEATGDRLALLPPQEVVYLSDFALRGGGYDSGSNDCRAEQRAEGRWDLQLKVGFRVVCVSAAPTPGPVIGPGDGRAALSVLKGTDCDDTPLLHLRAGLYGRVGDWRSAVADYRRLAERLPEDFDVWSEYAALSLRAGGPAAYGAIRRQMLEQFWWAGNPVIAERIAKASLLGEGGGLDQVMRLLDAANGKDTQDWARPYAELARGMGEYRRGDSKAALVWLKRCQDPGRVRLNDGAEALRGFFRAMAHHRLGQRDEAEKASKEASVLLASLVSAQASRADDSWKDILRATIAEAEARGRLKEVPPGD